MKGIPRGIKKTDAAIYTGGQTVSAVKMIGRIQRPRLVAAIYAVCQFCFDKGIPVRRYFYEALEANPKSIGEQVLMMIGELYKVEENCKKESLQAEEIRKRRKKHSKPILKKIHAWLIKHQPQVLPKSLLGKAIFYALSNWKALNVYVEDGRLEIDNNRSERCMKSIVLGRKNYMFMGSVRGGRAAATIYSLTETCKLNDVDPVAYFADVLARIPTHPNKRIHELLPYHWKSPEFREEEMAAQNMTEKIA